MSAQGSYNASNGRVPLAEEQGSDSAHGSSPQPHCACDAVLPQVSYCCLQVIHLMRSQGNILALRLPRPLQIREIVFAEEIYLGLFPVQSGSWV